MWKERLVNIFAAVTISFVGCPIFLVFLPGLSPPIIYQSVVSLGAGILFAYLYRKFHPDFKSYLLRGVVLSVFLSVSFSIYAQMVSALVKIGEYLRTLTMGTVTEMTLIRFDKIVDPYIGFVLSLLMFNCVFFYHYLKMPDRDLKLLWWYLACLIAYIYIPHIIFFGLPIVQFLNHSTALYYTSFILISLALGCIIFKIMNDFQMKPYNYAITAVMVSLILAVCLLSSSFIVGMERAMVPFLNDASLGTLQIDHFLPYDILPNQMLVFALGFLFFSLPFVPYLYKHDKKWLLLLLVPLLYFVLTYPVEWLGEQLVSTTMIPH